MLPLGQAQGPARRDAYGRGRPSCPLVLKTVESLTATSP